LTDGLRPPRLDRTSACATADHDDAHDDDRNKPEEQPTTEWSS
jgi:hypothetical protein